MQTVRKNVNKLFTYNTIYLFMYITTKELLYHLSDSENTAVLQEGSPLMKTPIQDGGAGTPNTEEAHRWRILSASQRGLNWTLASASGQC